MANGKHISYLRVSTREQGDSRLGIDAQRASVKRYLDDGVLVAEYIEIESGKKNDRPRLIQALAHARSIGARLVIAKLDRLARNVAFTANLMESGVEFVCADNPHANRLTIHILAAVAEDEARAISQRTRDALGSIKAKLQSGVVHTSKAGREVRRLGSPTGGAHLRGLGNAPGIAAVRTATAQRDATLIPIVEHIQRNGRGTLQAIADELNRRGILTRRGGHWHPTTVKLMLDRRG